MLVPSAGISNMKYLGFPDFIGRFSYVLSQPKDFTPGQRMPSSIIMKYKGGIYSIDSDSSLSTDKNILTWMVGIPALPFVSLLFVHVAGDVTRKVFNLVSGKLLGFLVFFSSIGREELASMPASVPICKGSCHDFSPLQHIFTIFTSLRSSLCAHNLTVGTIVYPAPAYLISRLGQHCLFA
jgi:hypothetical protein